MAVVDCERILRERECRLTQNIEGHGNPKCSGAGRSNGHDSIVLSRSHPGSDERQRERSRQRTARGSDADPRFVRLRKELYSLNGALNLDRNGGRWGCTRLGYSNFIGSCGHGSRGTYVKDDMDLLRDGRCARRCLRRYDDIGFKFACGCHSARQYADSEKRAGGTGLPSCGRAEDKPGARRRGIYRQCE